ncbi:hypothetical protein K6V72_04335 [Ralstonia insidiosa]|uniref:hypothetical protein n=1 Tax=Ralstonia insidiosa TaxID=190721 RepID=UPI000AD87F13|nr:hypothetical protein [Ralstonia insidiosa]MBY4908207.1 hypothetical protein [Ralstonia insidiosa]
MRRRQFLVLGCAAGLVVAGPTAATDLIGDALNGYWLVTVIGEAKERLLLLDGAALQDGKLVVGKMRYGLVEAAALSDVHDVAGFVEGDHLQLEFSSIVNSRIRVVLTAGDTSLLGELRYPNGRTVNVRMTRITADEAAATQAAARKMLQDGAQGVLGKGSVGSFSASGKLQARANSRIALVYAGAINCPACRGYQAEYFGRMAKMKTALPELDQIDYVQLKLGGFTARIRPEDLPPTLAWAGGERPDGRRILLNHGVPFFFAAIDEQIWGQAHAVSGLEGIVLPQIRLALQERARARAT